MTGKKAYYISRAIISVVFGALLILTGSTWWTGLLVGVLAFAWFLVAPRIGRYNVHPELGVTALRRDERAEIINNKAARNAFVTDEPEAVRYERAGREAVLHGHGFDHFAADGGS